MLAYWKTHTCLHPADRQSRGGMCLVCYARPDAANETPRTRVVKHSYRCGAYLQILVDPIPGETMRDVDRRCSEAVEQDALTCTCYRRSEVS